MRDLLVAGYRMVGAVPRPTTTYAPRFFTCACLRYAVAFCVAALDADAAGYRAALFAHSLRARAFALLVVAVVGQYTFTIFCLCGKRRNAGRHERRRGNVRFTAALYWLVNAPATSVHCSGDVAFL